MATIEEQLAEIDKRLETLDAEIKGVVSILVTFAATLGEDNPKFVNLAINALKTFERASKITNEHTRTIERIRYMRGVFDDVLHGRHRVTRQAAPGNGRRNRKK